MNTHTKTWRWWVFLLVFALILGTMALLGLVFFTNNTTSTNGMVNGDLYLFLWLLNGTLATVVLGLMFWVGGVLILRLRRHQFGSKLLLKLTLIFALVGFVPGVLIYGVSYQFVNRSIESWFDVKLETALQSGVILANVGLDGISNQWVNQLKADIKLQINESHQSPHPPATTINVVNKETINDLQHQYSLIQWWNEKGQPVPPPFVLNNTNTNTNGKDTSTTIPTPLQFLQAKTKGAWFSSEGVDDGNHTTPKMTALLFDEQLKLYLQASQNLPKEWVANAFAINEANRQYQQRALDRNGLRRMYIGTLTLTLFLAMFGALLLAVFFGAQLAAPLLLLAQGVQQVMQGDLTPKNTLPHSDELSGLTRSFAEMTQQLLDARTALQHSMLHIHTNRDNLQTILDNLTSGVVVFDAQGKITTANPSAARILHVSVLSLLDKRLNDIAICTPNLSQFTKEIAGLFAFEQTTSGLDENPKEKHKHQNNASSDLVQKHWQKPLVLPLFSDKKSILNHHNGDVDAVHLLARGTQLSNPSQMTNANAMHLLVFDDVSDLIAGQRAQAWSEVARRLAHEIKNPLTPIQLSAQRLEHKLHAKLSATDQILLSKSVKTIVDQVAAMQRLVNEFRDYARLPTAHLKRMDLNSFLTEMCQLYAGHHSVKIHFQPEIFPVAPFILGDFGQLQQVFYNLLNNAIDASISAIQSDMSIHTQDTQYKQLRTVNVSTTHQNNHINVYITDMGSGFAPHILKRAFEPYVTTKKSGTGLGLAMVQKIIIEHNARIELSNIEQEHTTQGAQVKIIFKLDA